MKTLIVAMFPLAVMALTLRWASLKPWQRDCLKVAWGIVVVIVLTTHVWTDSGDGGGF